jgi:hypothetical protein
MTKLEQDAKSIHPNFEYEIRPSVFPSDIDGITPWKDMFKPCSLQRLFLPVSSKLTYIYVYGNPELMYSVCPSLC